MRSADREGGCGAYKLDEATKQMKLWPVDPAMTDAEREEWNVPSLAEAKAREARMGSMFAK